MDDEKTIAEEVAEEAAETIDEQDIDQAKDRVEDAEDIDTDAIRDEIRDEDDDTRGRIDEVIDKLAGIEARLDGISRMLIDGGAVIRDGSVADPIDDISYVDIEDLDFSR